MIPNITRGGDTLRLLRYLTGRGRRDEHESPRLVAGEAASAMLDYGGRELTPADAGGMAALLDAPMRDFGTAVTVAEKDADGQPTGVRKAAHVWHCSLSLAPEEPDQTDGRWRDIAQRFVADMGLDPQDGTPACRWVAVRHGRSNGDSDHVHLVVNLVREDGAKASVHMDRPRAQRVSRALEKAFGLRVVEGRERGAGERGVKPAEVSAARHGGPSMARIPDDHAPRRRLERVVRACATAAEDEADFVGRLREERVLVRPRFEKDDPTRVVGYSVALRPTGEERPVWYGGGRLSRELTLPRLRAAWPTAETPTATAWARPGDGRSSPVASSPMSREEVAAVSAQLAELRERLAGVSVADASTWALVARDTAGVLAALSLRTEAQPGPLAAAARTIARSAQVRSSRVPGQPRRPFPPTRSAAALVLRGSSAPVSSRRLLAQTVSLAGALSDMHAAAGDRRRAAELERDAVARLRTVQAPELSARAGSALQTDRPRRHSGHETRPNRGQERD